MKPEMIKKLRKFKKN